MAAQSRVDSPEIIYTQIPKMDSSSCVDLYLCIFTHTYVIMITKERGHQLEEKERGSKVCSWEELVGGKRGESDIILFQLKAFKN